MNEGQTHWVGCWAEPRHHACAITEIERLEAECERLADECEMHCGLTVGANKRIAKLEAVINDALINISPWTRDCDYRAEPDLCDAVSSLRAALGERR